MKGPIFALVPLAYAWLAFSIPMLAPRAPSSSKVVIAQMFEWTWDSVASECTNFLGPAGYGFVQVSPPQETITGTQWWTDYQPVSYTLVGKRGDRAQFSSMVTTCHAAGVKVIADTIWNHMAGVDSGTGTAGDSFTHYTYPIYSFNDFHHCGNGNGDDISNYDNATEVQFCELDNLADLATETEYVRGKLVGYANDLISLGVDGLRLDAAKHIATADIANMVSRLSSKVYITQEVIYGAGEPITPSQYVANGDVQEFRYTTYVKNAFTSNGISGLQNLDSQGWISGSVATVFVANHDTERNGGSLNYNSASNTYALAMIFSLAHPYGTPSILSSYTYSTTDDGAPNSGTGTCSTSGGTNGWICQHRTVGAMVGFRNTVGASTITNWVSPASNQIAFGRGALGYVAINNADSSWSTSFQTSLPPGTYCNAAGVPTALSGTACAGSSFTVASGGTFTATISARSAIALHTGALCTASSCTGTGGSTVSVAFAATVTTNYGENVFVVGSLSQLGTWTPASGIALSSASYPVWKATVSLPASTAFTYKYIKKETDGSFVWESDPNRSATTSSSGSQTLNDSWR